MPQKRVTVTVSVPQHEVYGYLRGRYESDNFRTACLAAKGYWPRIECLHENQKDEMRFTVPGRDPMLRIPIGGWTWGYSLSAVSKDVTEVTIWYKWGLHMSLLGVGTMGHQAANELIETVLALDALALARVPS